MPACTLPQFLRFCVATRSEVSTHNQTEIIDALDTLPRGPDRKDSPLRGTITISYKGVKVSKEEYY